MKEINGRFHNIPPIPEYAANCHDIHLPTEVSWTEAAKTPIDPPIGSVDMITVEQWEQELIAEAQAELDNGDYNGE